MEEFPFSESNGLEATVLLVGRIQKVISCVTSSFFFSSVEAIVCLLLSKDVVGSDFNL